MCGTAAVKKKFRQLSCMGRHENEYDTVPTDERSTEAIEMGDMGPQRRTDHGGGEFVLEDESEAAAVPDTAEVAPPGGPPAEEGKKDR